MSTHKNQESQPPTPPPPFYPDINSSSSAPQESVPGPSATPAEAEKWGTHVMGTPAVPTCHPSNQKAAMWGVGDQKEYQNHHQPYVQYAPVDRNANATFNSVLHKFNTWSSKAEATANNIWQHLKTGPSVSGAAWGKMNVGAKAITGGGFESLYKQSFATYPNEVLKKSFACYLSTSTGPVAGTLYLSNVHVAFCSDRPLSFTAPSGQETWSYYKVMIPLAKVGSTNPVVMRENPSERYIQLVSTDGHDFWFMGFVNYDKATNHLFDAISAFAASGVPAPHAAPPPAGHVPAPHAAPPPAGVPAPHAAPPPAGHVPAPHDAPPPAGVPAPHDAPPPAGVPAPHVAPAPADGGKHA